MVLQADVLELHSLSMLLPEFACILVRGEGQVRNMASLDFNVIALWKLRRLIKFPFIL